MITLRQNTRFTFKYSACKLVDETECELITSLFDTNKQIQPLAYLELSLGHMGLIIGYDGHYHCLLMSGSNGYESMQSAISFKLYKFDQPSGKLTDLKNDTNITFCHVSMNKPLLDYYFELLHTEGQKYSGQDKMDYMLKMIMNKSF